MSIRLYLFILLIIFLVSATSVTLLLHYMNPIPNPPLAFSLLGIGIFLTASSLLAPILFFMKKVYYRGDVNLGTMNASIRQSILIATGIIFLGALLLYHITEWHILLTALTTLGCIEVMFQAID